MKRQFVFNATRMKERRKDLRRKQTESEEILWSELRAHKLGFKFKRQYSLGNYVADFFCREKKLAIELEGEIHKNKEVQKYDKYRMQYFEALGVKVIRIENEEITGNLEEVLNKIQIELKSIPSTESGEGNKRGEVVK